MAMPRKDQPAALKRRIERLEGQLAAEKAAHDRTLAGLRETVYELVDLRLRQQRAMAALSGEDE